MVNGRFHEQPRTDEPVYQFRQGHPEPALVEILKQTEGFGYRAAGNVVLR